MIDGLAKSERGSCDGNRQSVDRQSPIDNPSIDNLQPPIGN
jgi:hypothetical protein